jgi:D-arabinose 1-dehydrogenase-like Zn-dependent alcohol dehydrogenase
MAAKSNHVFRTVDGKVQKVAAEATTALKPNEVLLKITHSGLCSSDVFYIPSGMVLGHEGVGIVQEIGSAVTEFKIGDRAGGGYLRNVRHCSFKCSFRLI